MKIRLSDGDRERLTAPEWLDIGEVDSLTVADAIALEQASGLEWIDAMRRGATAWKSRVWLGLKRAGVDVDYEDLDFDLLAARLDTAAVEVEPGKASPGS